MVCVYVVRILFQHTFLFFTQIKSVSNQNMKQFKVRTYRHQHGRTHVRTEHIKRTHQHVTFSKW